MTDKKLAKKVRDLAEEYMKEHSPKEYQKVVDNKVAWEIILETVIR